jgi:hypothetical protein
MVYIEMFKKWYRFYIYALTDHTNITNEILAAYTIGGYNLMWQDYKTK